jgi:hypothetical protein
MSNFMMNLISWILLLLVILTLYLIDKVNQLARLQEQAEEDVEKNVAELQYEAPPGDILFAGLEGKPLWDAMSGKHVDGFEPSRIDALRPHYEPILREHIQTTFQDGLEDAESGSAGTNPESLRVIPTSRGEVDSWLPPQYLGSIYRTAMEFGGEYLKTREPDTLIRLRETLDSVTELLYQRAGLKMEIPYSALLMDLSKFPPPPPEPEPEPIPGLLADPSEPPSAAELAQGLAQVKEYEAQQQADHVAEQAVEVLDPIQTPAEGMIVEAGEPGPVAQQHSESPQAGDDVQQPLEVLEPAPASLASAERANAPA